METKKIIEMQSKLQTALSFLPPMIQSDMLGFSLMTNMQGVMLINEVISDLYDEMRDNEGSRDDRQRHSEK